MNKYLRWHDQITRSRGPKRNVTYLRERAGHAELPPALSATRLSLDSSSLIDTSSLKDHLYVPQPTPKPTRWQPKGSSVACELVGRLPLCFDQRISEQTSHFLKSDIGRKRFSCVS